MEWFIAVVIVAALGVAAVAAAGGLGGMAKEPRKDVYRQDLPVERPLGAEDINKLRFGTALRGYAMDQVDDILDRLSREIAERDAVIAGLRSADAPETQPVEGEPVVPIEPGEIEPDELGAGGTTSGGWAADDRRSEPDQASMDVR